MQTIKYPYPYPSVKATTNLVGKKKWLATAQESRLKSHPRHFEDEMIRIATKYLPEGCEYEVAERRHTEVRGFVDCYFTVYYYRTPK